MGFINSLRRFGVELVVGSSISGLGANMGASRSKQAAGVGFESVKERKSIPERLYSELLGVYRVATL